MNEADRQAQREVIAKDVNDVIVEGVGASADGTVSVLCECGRDHCEEWLAVDAESYALTQSDDTLFVVAPGHQALAFERVVKHSPTYFLVNKVGEAGEEADRIDDHEERA